MYDCAHEQVVIVISTTSLNFRADAQEGTFCKRCVSKPSHIGYVYDHIYYLIQFQYQDLLT